MQTLPITHIPRPTLPDAFLSIMLDPFLAWAADNKCEDKIPTVELVPSFLRALAIESHTDLVKYEKNLLSFDIQVNEQLRSLLSSALKKQASVLRSLEMEWVMLTGIRWRFKVGSELSIKDPLQWGTHRSAKVVSVDKVTAKATLEYTYKPKDRVVAHAEHFLHV